MRMSTSPAGSGIYYVKPCLARDQFPVHQVREIRAQRCASGNGLLRGGLGVHGANFPAIVSAGLRSYDTKLPWGGINSRTT
jgi:hypothetical protein